jgi:Transposase DDE domain
LWWRHDAARTAYVCPAGQEPTPVREGKLRELKKVEYGNAGACRACTLRPRCTKDASKAIGLSSFRVWLVLTLRLLSALARPGAGLRVEREISDVARRFQGTMESLIDRSFGRNRNE